MRVTAPWTDQFAKPFPFGMRAWLGFNPTSPVKAAGSRVDPPASVAVARGTMPAATAEEEPPLLPPGVFCGFQGLRVTPHALVKVAESMPNSDAAVFPIGMAPAARNLCT